MFSCCLYSMYLPHLLCFLVQDAIRIMQVSENDVIFSGDTFSKKMTQNDTHFSRILFLAPPPL